MPRGGRSRGRSMSPIRSAPPRTVARAPPPPQRAPVPVQQRPAAVAPAGAAQRQGPGLMGQMMATAGGVAIGSAVGHTIGHAMTGGSGGEQEQQQQPSYQEQPQQMQQYEQQPYGQQQQQQPTVCAFELRQFMDCAQNNSDITFCQDFNEALKQCKQAYGGMR